MVLRNLSKKIKLKSTKNICCNPIILLFSYMFNSALPHRSTTHSLHSLHSQAFMRHIHSQRNRSADRSFPCLTILIAAHIKINALMLPFTFFYIEILSLVSWKFLVEFSFIIEYPTTFLTNIRRIFWNALNSDCSECSEFRTFRVLIFFWIFLLF